MRRLARRQAGRSDSLRCDCVVVRRTVDSNHGRETGSDYSSENHSVVNHRKLGGINLCKVTPDRTRTSDAKINPGFLIVLLGVSVVRATTDHEINHSIQTTLVGPGDPEIDEIMVCSGSCRLIVSAPSMRVFGRDPLPHVIHFAIIPLRGRLSRFSRPLTSSNEMHHEASVTACHFDLCFDLWRCIQHKPSSRPWS
mgnify:CR=1 FL=1